MSQKEFADAIKALQRSPLFQLSLASKELFHSNFIAWICEKYPDFGLAIFGDLCGMQGQTVEVRVDREKDNIDLTMRFGDDTELIIENKVKSIPYKKQLDEYYEKKTNHKDAKDKQVRFLLLSLTPPSFFASLEEEKKWKYWSYDDLAGWLEKNIYLVSGEYERALVKDYIGFVKALSGLKKHYEFKPDEKFFRHSENSKKLRGIRLNDLVEKFRYEQLAEKVRGRLQEENACISKDPPLKNKSLLKAGYFWVETGFSNSVGLLDIKYGKEGGSYGIQIQGEKFKIFSEGMDVLRAKTAYENSEWFRFDENIKKYFEDKEYPKEDPKANSIFNCYQPKFYYRYRKLKSGITVNELVELIINFLKQRKLLSPTTTI